MQNVISAGITLTIPRVHTYINDNVDILIYYYNCHESFTSVLIEIND